MKKANQTTKTIRKNLATMSPWQRREEVVLESLFRMVRRYRRNPPIDTVIEMLVAVGEDIGSATRFVEKFRAVIRVALEVCGGNRQMAFVAAAMELRCHLGYRDHPEWDLRQLTGLRRRTLGDCLALLCRAGIADVYDFRFCGHRGHPMLVRPLTVRPMPKATEVFGDDPIELLRLDPEELSNLPYDALKAGVIRAALQAAEDPINEKESEILTKIGRCMELAEAEGQARNPASRRRLNEQWDRFDGLVSDLSNLRWQRRQPFRPQVPEDERA